MLHFFLNVCGSLPNLRELSLAESFDGPLGRHISGYDFLRELTANLASSECSIERFTISNIGCPLLQAIGKLFQAWPNLKFLRMGDADNQNGPYGNDGRPDFHAYAPVSKILNTSFSSVLIRLR
jgi:hypothetical protein